MAEFGVTYVMEDAYQRKTRKVFSWEGLDHAAAIVAAASMAIDLADVSEAEILWYTVAEKVVYADSVVAGANVDEGVTLTVRKADNEKAPLTIPAPINAMVNADASVDLTNAALIAFMDNFISGGFRISDHEIVTVLLKGKLDK